MNKKPTQKDFWITQQLEYLHNCFIGISNLTCSNSDCPLVYNWGEIEKKQSKKGKAAFYKISEGKWVVVGLEKYEENDLGEYENIEIKFKSGKSQRTKPTEDREPQKSLQVSGTRPNESKPKKEIFLKAEEIILFFNNSNKKPNLEDAESIYLNDLWDIKEKIKWDQKASKKKIINWVEQKVDDEDKAYKIDEWENDYIFNIHNPDITNEIKHHEVYSGKDNKEREQLWKDFEQGWSELKEVYGIRHNIQQKEERQNNPEIDMIKAPFLALERDKRRERMKSIKDFEEKGGCEGIHTLSYGSLGEHQQEMIIQQEVENLEEEVEKEEQKDKEVREILHRNLQHLENKK